MFRFPEPQPPASEAVGSRCAGLGGVTGTKNVIADAPLRYAVQQP